VHACRWPRGAICCLARTLARCLLGDGDGGCARLRIPLVEDPGRVEEVTSLGIDGRRFCGRTTSTRLCTSRAWSISSDGCSELEVHPVVPGTTGSLAQPATVNAATAEIAVVHAGSLVVVNEVTGRRLVLARGASNQLGSGTDTPAFSADGDWVAYLDQVSGAPSSLRVTRSSGSVVVAIPGVLSFSCRSDRTNWRRLHLAALSC